MPTIASLIVRIGANDQEIQNALTSVGQKAKSIDADLKKLGNSPLATNATKSLDALKATMKQITDQQERVADRARLAAQGLEAMGGASRLTDSQLKQVNRTLQDGLSAYRALGKEAPEDLKRVGDAVKTQLEKPMGFIETKAIALGTAIGTFLGNAVLQVGREFIQAGKRAFDYADALDNLSTSTRISVEGLQRIEALGVSSGVSLEQLAGSVDMLQRRLDDPAAINALRQMGLNYAEIRSLKPEDQFLEIAQAVAEIQDPIAQANAGAALFGRQWDTIAPAIKGNVREIIDGVRVLSKEQIDALDEAGDAWDQWVKDRERDVARFLGTLVLAHKKGRELQQTRLSPDIEQAAQLEALLGQELGNLPVRPQAPAARIGLGASVNSFTLEGLQALVELNKKDLEQVEERIKAAERFKTVQDQLYGRAIIANAELLVKAVGDAGNLTKLTEDATRKLHQELGQAIGVYRAIGQEVPPTLQEIYDKTSLIAKTPIEVKAVGGPSLQNLTKTFVAYGEIVADGTLVSEDFSLQMIDSQVKVDAFGRAIAVNLNPQVVRYKNVIDEAKEKTVSFGQAFKSIFTGKGFGDLGKALKGGLDDIKEGIFEGFGNLISQGIASLVNKGLGLLANGLKNLFGIGTAGRDAVRAFASEQGGFDALHDRLLLLGQAGEDLWKKLTQGVGRNNAEEAKRAIAEVTAALDEQKRKFEELQTAVSDVGTKLAEVTILTPELQTALDNVFSQSTTEGYLAALQAVNTELDKQKKAYDEIDQTLKKYGLSFKDAGKEFQQAKLNEKAIELRKDFDTLRKSGVDINAQMRAMGPSIREFIADAKKAGAEVPESFMEIIQTAIDAGEVFDEDGKKITHIDQLGLKFGVTMQTAMEQVGGAVDRLTLVLEGLATFLGIELPKSAKEGAEKINKELDKIEDPTIDIDFRTKLPDFIPGVTQPDGASRGALVKPWGLQYFQQGGMARGTDTVPAMLTPGELVLNAPQQQALNAALAAKPTVIVNVQVDGVFSEGDLVQTVQRRLVPIISQAWEDNVAGSRTRAQDVLGIAGTA